MSRQRYRLARYRVVAAVAAVAGLGLAASACSSSPATNSGGNVTVSINCAPTQAQNPEQHKEWNADVATFEKANPTITIKSIYNYPCTNLPTFTAQLRAGTEPDIFYIDFTDLPQVLTAGQAADITSYVNSKTVPNLKDIVPSAMKSVTAGKTIYGLPTNTYTQGLVYNRKLFSEAGLNPNDPPTTWAQVETDAKAIAKLGNGIEGWGDYSAGNNGGWHFASYMDALGGTTVTNAVPPTAGFDNADGLAILQALHTLRFTDNAMSKTQGLAWGALQVQFGAGKLGMYIAAPDDIYNQITAVDKGNINDIGMGPLPSLTGKPAGSLGGGNAYVFAKYDTPAQIKAGIKFIDFEDLTPGQGVTFNYARAKADGVPVGFDEPSLFDGAAGAQVSALRTKYTTINQSYYKAYVDANEVSDGEPFDAQAVYKTLDPMMLAVLTEPTVNIPALLKTSATNVTTLLQFSA
jgi:ABC-type glycerol-3-phosphate transport system substrate-binding protein